jgi:hypothetical protein
MMRIREKKWHRSLNEPINNETRPSLVLKWTARSSIQGKFSITIANRYF